jgi:hypothetical protein
MDARITNCDHPCIEIVRGGRPTMYLTAAGLLAIAIGATHSILGERNIFWAAEGSALAASPALPAGRHRGILRATWHATTLFGFALAAILLHYASMGGAIPLLIRSAIAVALGASSIAVLWWTKGRHPGWIGLGLAAALTAIG